MVRESENPSDSGDTKPTMSTERMLLQVAEIMAEQYIITPLASVIQALQISRNAGLAALSRGYDPSMDIYNDLEPSVHTV